jgi:hypothetical protein
MRGEFFQPHIKVVQQSAFIIIYEHRSSYVYGINYTYALLDPAFLDKSLDRAGDVDESSPIRGFNSKRLCERFHAR